MICRCAKGPKASQIKNEMVLLSEITRFNQLELGELQTRFARMAKNSNFITKTQFRDNLGLLGLGTMLYISDRIFDIMDDDRDGKIRFKDFALYFDKVCNGDAREKAEISFKLIDRKKLGYFCFADFNSTMQGMINSWVAMTGQHLTPELQAQLESRVRQIFSIMDTQKNDKVFLPQYQQSMIDDPNLMEIFDFVKRGMKDFQEVPNVQEFKEEQQFHQIRQIEQKVRDLLEFMSTAEEPQKLKLERFSSYKKQKSTDQMGKIPHFVGDSEQVEQTNTRLEQFNSPIDMILHYDQNKTQLIPIPKGQQQTHSFHWYSEEDHFSPLNQQVDNDNKDFSFHQKPKCKWAIQPLFQQVPQKTLSDWIPDSDEMHLSNISERESEDQKDLKDVQQKERVEQYVQQAPESEIKEKYISVVGMVQGLADEVKQLRLQLDQEKYNKIKQETKIQFNEIHLQHLRASTAGNVHRNNEKKKQRKKQKISVSFGHENFNLVLNMMIGIQMAVNSINMTDDYEIGPKDFKLKYYFELLPRRKQSDKSSFKVCQFFDYAPRIFNSIRTIHGIDNQSYLKSIGPESLLQSLLKGDLSTLQELTSTGKSGSFFYYTADGKFTLKTVHKHEFRFLKQILRSYYQHITKNIDSLIIKFFGMHKIGIKYQTLMKEKVIYFVIMSNIFSTSKEIHVRYDLKGSLYKRETNEPDPTIARKDLNFLKDKQHLRVEMNKKLAFLEQLEKDCQWFAQNNIIDYSLLVGIHNRQQKNLEYNESSIYSDNPYYDSLQIINSIDQEQIFYFGIIDILTNFSTKKKIEYLSKRIYYGPTISAIPPQDYSIRFYDFMNKNLFA